MISFTGPRKPGWAQCLSNRNYKYFIKALQAYFEKTNQTYKIVEETIEIQTELGRSILGLNNLAQFCSYFGTDSYERIIQEHLDVLYKAAAQDKEFSNLKSDFSKVKDLISVKLFSEDNLGSLNRNEALVKEIIPGLFMLPVFELENTVRNIIREEMQAWNIKESELFRLGMSNNFKKYPPEINCFDEDDIRIYSIISTHPFASNILLRLGSYKEINGVHGALVACPTRHCVLVYPINDFNTVRACSVLIPTIHQVWQDGPGSLSKQLYWYKSGHFESLHYWLDGNCFKFDPCERFMRMLKSMEPDGFSRETGPYTVPVS